MIFPDKPRPPWQKPRPVPVTIGSPEPQPREVKPSKPPGYWRERIEFGLICVGFYFWVQYWIQYQ